MRFTALIALLLTMVVVTKAGNYSQALELLKHKLSNETYNRRLRPLFNQDDIINVTITFTPVTILDVDDVGEIFSCNGFVSMLWTDEILVWDPADYGNITEFQPEIKDIWKPQLSLLNTVGERDPFGDKLSPMIANSGGFVEWYPGGTISTTCELDMKKYPFDQQTCHLQFHSISIEGDKLQLVANDERMFLYHYSENSVWELVESRVATGIVDLGYGYTQSFVTFTFVIKRRFSAFLLNILLPVGFLSVLNILVFIIPVESGDRIQYSMTVLLAQAVFMTILMSLLPTSFQRIPYVTIYVFSLLVIAVATVISSILVVFFHYKDQEEVGQQNIRKKTETPENVEDASSEVVHRHSQSGSISDYSSLDQQWMGTSATLKCVPWSDNKSWKQLGRALDKILFIVCTLSLIIVTFIYFVSVMS